MNRRMTRSLPAALALLVAALALVAAPAPASARPFDASRIPAGVQGVGHVDVDALRKTQLFGADSALANLKRSDMDLPAELRPVVDYLIDGARGLSFWIGKNDSGALVLEVADGKKLGLLLDKLPHKGELTLAGVKVRRLAFDGDDSLVGRVGDLVVLCDDQASMTRTLQALTGKGKTLAGRPLPAGARDPGVFFFAALDDQLLERVKQAASSATLKADLTSLAISVGEVKAELRARVTAEVTTAEGAQQIKGVLDGLRALVALAGDDAKEVKPLLDRLQITATGKRIEVSFAMPSAELVKILQAAN
jgi:hypothetical protein